jgi:hypothetical protein
MRIALGLLLGVLSTQPAWCVVKTRSNPKARAIHRACILPAEAQMVRLSTKGGEPLPKEAEEWAGKLNATVAHIIKIMGGQSVGDLSDEGNKNDEDARQAVVRVKQKYESIAAQFA